MSLFCPNFVQPRLYLDSVLELNAGDLCKNNIDTLLLDVDCTLKDHGSTDLNPGVAEWLDSMRTAGVKMCLLSNGRTQRIGKLAGRLGLPFLGMAFKPSPLGCWKAMRNHGLQPKQTAIVGDQLFADVMAGNLAGIFTILVRPSSPVEPWFTRLKRPLERRILLRMDAECMMRRWQSAVAEQPEKIAVDA